MTINPARDLGLLQRHLQDGAIDAALAAAMALARKGALPVIDLFNAAHGLGADGRSADTIALYRTWLEHTDSPVAYAAHFNLAVTLSGALDDVGAEAAYRRALALKPTFIEGHLNLGTLLERLGRVDEALDLWRAVPALGDPASPNDIALHVQAYNNLGRVLEIRRQLPEAERMLRESLRRNPDQRKVLTHFVHLRQKQCEWPVYCDIEGVDPQAMRAATSALAMLGLSNEPAEQLAAALTYVRENVAADCPRLSPAGGYAHRRLRIGYLSSDLHAHAVAILTAELYELHDREQVEVYAFCWSTEDGTPMRRRLLAAFDHVVRIGALSDAQAAQAIRDNEIDILVDLHGLTQGTRPGILAWHAAPVQLTWLGFPGPTALPGIDYVLADRFVLPPELAPHFVERPLYLPDSFQVNDRQREVGPRPTRAACKLPESAFVFCSFNNSYKITEEMFACWMRILARSPASVLWLVSDHDVVRTNLRAAAAAAGVDPARLLFAERVGPIEYLARYQVADLFLDTMPFNAGTTASDALWAGLPLLTCAGKTFSSRMAGSLLHAVGLPQLVCDRLQDYEEVAVRLAGAPAEAAALKEHLVRERASCALFDTPRFVRALEQLYAQVAVRSAPVAPARSAYNNAVFDLLRPAYAQVVDTGGPGGALGAAYCHANPDCHYTGIAAAGLEQLDPARWASLARADCWVFDGVLERLPDPQALLARIARDAAPGTEVVACIANAQYWALQLGLNQGQVSQPRNGAPFQLTRIAIIEMLAAAGFSVETMIARHLEAPAEAVAAALRQLAMAGGADPDQALADAIPFQYVVRAVAGANRTKENV